MTNVLGGESLVSPIGGVFLLLTIAFFDPNQR